MMAFGEAARGLVLSAAGHVAFCTVVVACAAVLARLLQRSGPGLRHALWFWAACSFLLPFGVLAGLGSALGRQLPRVASVEAIPDFSALLRYSGAAAPAPAAAPQYGLWSAVVLLWAVGVVVLAAKFARGLGARPAAVRAPNDCECEAVRRAAAAVGVRGPVEIVVTAPAGAPAVAGVFHPVLLLPERLGEHLEEAELAAVLMHEMAHVRRRDNLAAAVVRVAVSLFWFFPLVWWLERKMCVEREFACDEMVVGGGVPPQRYASGLLKTCGLCYAGVPAGTAAATGSNLAKRVEGIMSISIRRRSPFAARLAAAGLAVAICAAPLAAGLWGGMQAPGQTLEKRKGAEFVKAEIVGTPSNHSDPMATLSKLFSVYETPLAPNASNWARWLAEEVALIIVPEERAAFLRLTDDAEREHFITQFWQRRNPEGRDASRNRFKDEHYRRIRYANERFAKAEVPGWQTDRGRLYIVMGPPDEMEVHPSEHYEVWTYRRFDDTPDMLSITFRI